MLHRAILSDFNPRPPRGGRPRPRPGSRVCWTFQSTPPARGATDLTRTHPTAGHISIHAPREGGDQYRAITAEYDPIISIHAPREGGDRGQNSGADRRHRNFNPRPPRGGRHPCSPPSILKFSFQSTPPARGATVGIPNANTDKKISIHAPREGGDCITTFMKMAGRPFQSTPPARGATWWSTRSTALKGISIHAPREGGDIPSP